MSQPALQRRLPVELLADRAPSLRSVSRAGFASVEQLYDAVAAQFKLARIQLGSVVIPADLTALVARDLAEKHHLVPVFADGHEVSLAVCDPTQLGLFDWLGRELRRVVTIVVATPQEIARAQSRLYAARRVATIEEPGQVSNEDLAAASNVFNALVAGAVEQRAGDIHVEATEHHTIVRYRVDGALRDVETRPVTLHAAIVSRIKVLANLNIANHHAPQDGRIKIQTPAAEVDLRVSVLFTYWGEKVVCRVLDNKRAAMSLDALGFEPSRCSRWRPPRTVWYG